MTEEKTTTFSRRLVWELALTIRQNARTSLMDECMRQALRELVAAEKVLEGEPFALRRSEPRALEHTEGWVTASVVGDSIQLTPAENPDG